MVSRLLYLSLRVLLPCLWLSSIPVAVRAEAAQPRKEKKKRAGRKKRRPQPAWWLGRQVGKAKALASAASTNQALKNGAVGALILLSLFFLRRKFVNKKRAATSSPKGPRTPEDSPEKKPQPRPALSPTSSGAEDLDPSLSPAPSEVATSTYIEYPGFPKAGRKKAASPAWWSGCGGLVEKQLALAETKEDILRANCYSTILTTLSAGPAYEHLESDTKQWLDKSRHRQQLTAFCLYQQSRALENIHLTNALNLAFEAWRKIKEIPYKEITPSQPTLPLDILYYLCRLHRAYTQQASNRGTLSKKVRKARIYKRYKKSAELLRLGFYQAAVVAEDQVYCLSFMKETILLELSLAQNHPRQTELLGEFLLRPAEATAQALLIQVAEERYPAYLEALYSYFSPHRERSIAFAHTGQAEVYLCIAEHMEKGGKRKTYLEQAVACYEEVLNPGQSADASSFLPPLSRTQEGLCYYGLADACLQLGRYEQATKAIQKAIALYQAHIEELQQRQQQERGEQTGEPAGRRKRYPPRPDPQTARNQADAYALLADIYKHTEQLQKEDQMRKKAANILRKAGVYQPRPTFAH